MSMVIHLLDGTYELFRHFYGNRRRDDTEKTPPLAAVHGVLHLCGHDHETDEGEMLALQARVIEGLA